MGKTNRWLPSKKTFLHDLCFSTMIFILATILNLVLIRISGRRTGTSDLYILAVLLIALKTTAYFWGIVASFMGVFGVNYLFTFPFYKINFTLSGYPLTFLSMLFVALIANSLAVRVVEQMELVQSRERRTQELNRISQQLLVAQDRDVMAQLLIEHLVLFFERSIVFCWKEKGELLVRGSTAVDFDNTLEREALYAVFHTGQPAGNTTQSFQQCDYWYVPIAYADRVLAVVGIMQKGYVPVEGERMDFLRLVLSQFSLALERQRLELERQAIRIESEKEQMRSNLLRAISHDLRTPLTGIIGASSVILENGELIDMKSIQKLIKGINEDAGWLLGMVENVLSVTRITGGAPKLKKTPEPIEEVVEQAVSRCKKRFDQTEICASVPEEFLMVPMDSTLIEQVLINLIENAITHGGMQTAVDVSVTYREGNAVFAVRDYGKGIDPMERANLFNGFSSRNQKTSDSGRGLGIGLSLCRSIIQAHGGEIWGENNLDCGATFTFTLPLEGEKDDREKEHPDR